MSPDGSAWGFGSFWRCRGCQRVRPQIALKSRCLMQHKANAWNGISLDCCCLNSIRKRACDDPSGMGWVRE